MIKKLKQKLKLKTQDKKYFCFCANEAAFTVRKIAQLSCPANKIKY